MKLLLLLVLLFSKTFSVERIEMVCNYAIDTDYFTSLGIKAVLSDLNHYSIGKENHNIFSKFFHKWSLDFWKDLSVDKEVKKIVFFNVDNRFRRDRNLAHLPKDKLVLFMWEPPIVLPRMYKKSIWECFGKIYTWDDDLVDGVTFFKLYYPELKPMRQDLPTFEEKKLCTFVGSCLYSKRKGSLYDERRKAIAFFESVEEPGFEFYGKKWDACLYKSYRGAVADKLNTIKNYRFSICYENSCDRRGYITEKIFDCFAAGCVPIYWGAPNIEDYIPKSCFIDRRDFKSMQALYSFLKGMSKEQYESYLQNIRNFLNSEKAQLFSRSHFERIFTEAILNRTLAQSMPTTTSKQTVTGIA